MYARYLSSFAHSADRASAHDDGVSCIQSCMIICQNMYEKIDFSVQGRQLKLNKYSVGRIHDTLSSRA